MDTGQLFSGITELLAEIPDGKVIEPVGDCLVLWVHQDEYVIVGPACDFRHGDPCYDPVGEAVSEVLRWARRTWFCKFESYGDFVMARLYAAT